MRWGLGDVAVSVKYRFYQDDDAGLSIAAFPGMTLSTATYSLGNNRVTGFLPVWVQKNLGSWSVFGGGGYTINPDAGNRNYLTGGIAVSRQVAPKLPIGIEADLQGADRVGGNGETSLGLGAIWHLKAPFRLPAPSGPTFDDGDGAAGFHAVVALGLDL
jgi:Putative MetA-pathway of phenol degradation